VNRSLKVERLYSLGDYKNIKFIDEINDLPEEVIFNDGVVSKIRYLQLISLELNIRKYMELMRAVQTVPLEEQLQYLEEQKVNTLDEIKQLLIKE
jgi:hypothetical protein